MKNAIKFSFLIVFLCLLFAGCEKIKSIADVTFDAEFTADLPVDVVPTSLKAGVNGTFFETATIDPLSNSDLATYADKIKKIEVIEASAEVLSIDPSPVLLLSTTLSATSGVFSPATWSFNNESLTVGKIITLDNENSQFSNLQSILDSKEIFTVTLQGQTDVDEASFTVRVKYKTKVTANPL
ncbi:MAG: hypothetical protein CVT92_09985 [Bacteroidetes bacterium HGW-Bacteroidetes-1]|jgi:hypothetical protein|nr:MAG: hypothetical protein CVT92_09985 [Bacteroidetes bacterium HGW-Bacteroidetes-1]